MSKRCPRCAGSGEDPEEKVNIQRFQDPEPVYIPAACRTCKGTGKVPDEQMELDG